MAAKTYNFTKFTKREEFYMAKASEIHFLPAQNLRIRDLFNKPGFTDFVLSQKSTNGWVFAPRRPNKETANLYLCIVND
jgi:hypothetical protein